MELHNSIYPKLDTLSVLLALFPPGSKTETVIKNGILDSRKLQIETLAEIKIQFKQDLTVVLRRVFFYINICIKLITILKIKKSTEKQQEKL